MVDELVVATGDNDGDDNPDGGRVSGKFGKGKSGPSSFSRSSNSGSPSIELFRRELAAAEEQVNSANNYRELSYALQALLEVKLTIANQVKDYINSTWPNCDINNRILSHNRDHHAGAGHRRSSSDCEDPSHVLIEGLKRSLDPRRAARLELLINSDNSTPEELRELSDLVASSLRAADPEQTVLIASAFAKMLGGGDERGKVLDREYLTPLREIAVSVNRTTLALRAYGGGAKGGFATIDDALPSTPRSLLSRVQHEYPNSLRARVQTPFTLKFTPPWESSYTSLGFSGGEPWGGYARAVYMAAAWEKKIESQQRFQELSEEIRRHLYERFLAKSEVDRRSINSEISALQEQLNKLCLESGWPPITVTYYSLEA